MEKTKISSQITTFTNGKQRMSMYDHLKLSSIENYGEIHATRENIEGSGKKRRSLIYVELQDFSHGTGDDLIRATTNLTPAYLQDLLEIVKIRPGKYADYITKIFGNPMKRDFL